MWKQTAGIGAHFINGANAAVKKNTAIRAALQNASFIRKFDRVVTQKLTHLHAEMAGQALRITLANLSGSNAAAIGASRTVNRLFDFFGDCLKAPFDKIVPFQPGTKSLVFFALFLP
jgi:hypothetical protein